MIGNDVVDLELAKTESNWQRKGYLDKIYTDFEQNLIFTSKNPDEMVWVLWSLKESTYKAFQRVQYNRGYYPIKIQIIELKHIENQFHSKIELFGQIFYGITRIDTEMIHSIVTISKHIVIQVQDFVPYFKDSSGLPKNSITQKILSVSNHGRYHKTITID